MKNLVEYITESNIKTVTKFPDEMIDKDGDGDRIVIKIKGKKYLIKHFEERDKSYGKFHIFLDEKPIKLFDYGDGHKFYGYDFDKKYKAYDATKKFLENL
jgi:hypothetical protein